MRYLTRKGCALASGVPRRLASLLFTHISSSGSGHPDLCCQKVDHVTASPEAQVVLPQLPVLSRGPEHGRVLGRHLHTLQQAVVGFASCSTRRVLAWQWEVCTRLLAGLGGCRQVPAWHDGTAAAERLRDRRFAPGAAHSGLGCNEGEKGDMLGYVLATRCHAKKQEAVPRYSNLDFKHSIVAGPAPH